MDAHSPSRRRFLKLGAAAGAGGVVALVNPTAASGAAAATQATDVIIVDSLADLPAGTPAGTLVVIKT